MKKIRFEIEGIVPMLFNRFTEEAQSSLEKGSGGGKKTKEKALLEAEKKVYSDGETIGVPALNLKKTLLNGCRMAKIKFGKGSAEPYLRAIVFIDPDFLSLGKKNPDGIHECSGNIPPGPKGHKAMIRRPYVREGWILSGNISIVDDRIDPSIVEAALKEAGLLVGLNDHRPEYGRFKVNKFEVVDK